MDVTKKISSYEWSFIDPPPSDHYCPMCKQILKEPMLTNCCGSHFCKACIDPIIKAKKPCPHPECSETDYVCIVDKPKWRKILELDVMCPLKGRGCNWMGEVGTREKHLDPKEGDCEYIDVDCTYGCGEDMERYELDEHISRFCPKRPHTCQHCGYENVYEVIVGDHTQECPAYPMDCPNSCGNTNISRSSYDQHLLVCPEQEVECEFSYAGCEKRVLRKSMADHQRDDVYTHLSLQTAFASKQLLMRDQQLKELSSTMENRFKELTTEVEELKDQCKEREKESEWIKHELKRKETKIVELQTVLKMGLFLNISNDRKLTLKKGNLVNEDVDIIVNAAATHLHHNVGVAKALNLASNGQLQKYSDEYFKTNVSVSIGSVALTKGGGALKCKFVLHAFGPHWSDTQHFRDCLMSCIRRVLECAEKQNACSIAMPAISAGSLGGDKKVVARCIIDAITGHSFSKTYPVLSDIRIVIFDDNTYKLFSQIFVQKMAE